MSNTIHMRFVRLGMIMATGVVDISHTPAEFTQHALPFASLKVTGPEATSSSIYPADTIELGIERPDGEVWYEGDIIECKNHNGNVENGVLRRSTNGIMFFVMTEHANIGFDSVHTMRRIGNIHEKEMT